MSARARRVWITAIVVIAAVLRLARLGSTPPGVYCDEAAVGYNAFTMAHHGTDEFGTVLPLFFRSFGEYKNPVYIYADVPFVAALGMSPLSARLPAALFGTATVLAAILLAEAWFGVETGLATGIVLAFSPWHFVLSRLAFEAVSFPLFLTLGLWQLSRAVEEKSAPRAVLGAALLGVTPYCYGPAKAVVPFLVVTVLVLHRDALRERDGRRVLAATLGVLALASIPLLVMRLRHPDFDSRYDAIGVASLRTWKTSLAAHTLARFPAAFRATVESSPALERAWSVIVGYCAHLDPGFLFLWGDPNDRHGTHQTGLMLPAEALLFATGIAALWRRRAETPIRIVTVWLLVAPIAPALTLEGLPHAIRLLGGVPVTQMTCALGAVTLGRAFEARTRTLLAAGWLASALASASIYFTAYPARAGQAFQVSARELVRAVNAYPDPFCELRFVDYYEHFPVLWGFWSGAPPEAVRQMDYKLQFHRFLFDRDAHLAIVRADHPLPQCRVLATAKDDEDSPGWVLQECVPYRGR